MILFSSFTTKQEDKKQNNVLNICYHMDIVIYITIIFWPGMTEAFSCFFLGGRAFEPASSLSSLPMIHNGSTGMILTHIIHTYIQAAVCS